jgi:hypothetical protein
VPQLPVRGTVLAMSRVHHAPLALASDGTVLVNIAHFDGPHSTAALLALALKQPGPVFIGVVLSQEELEGALLRLSHGHAEAAAYVVGARQRRRRAR